MQLTSPVAPAAAPALAPAQPSGVIVNLATRADGRSGLTDSHRLETLFAPGATLSAHRSVHDQLWDGPVAQPVDPRSWRTEVANDATAPLADAVAGLRDALAGADLTRVPQRTATEREYATLHVRYPERPTNVDHLRPVQDRDGSWLVHVRTSQHDLFVDPQLAPVVDAARAVLAAARPR